jgi:glucose/mannose-6-phosphate isomerase
MEKAITHMHTQCSYVPTVHNGDRLRQYDQYILCGMGGSHLAAGILKMWKPGINLYVHKDYDLPPYSEAFFEKSLLIASSHSGNTEEVLSFARAGLERGFDVAVITTGGELLKFAETKHLPYIKLPDHGIQPRSALGYALIALATFAHEPGCISDMHTLGETFRAVTYRAAGEALSADIGDAIPVIYASQANMAIAYNWKIKCNETAKIPAFYNIFPELNHNEMQGFEYSGTNGLADFHFIFLQDAHDHSRIQARMKVTQALLQEKGHRVTVLHLKGESTLEKIFSSLALADWMALAIARTNDREPEAVPLIEAFKKRLQ